MSHSITIAGVERGGDVISQTINIEDLINEQANTLRFSIIDRQALGAPGLNDEVIVSLPDTTKIFAGNIVSVNLQKQPFGKVLYNVDCVDYTGLLDGKLVAKSYENMTDKDIIEDIVSTYATDLGITTNNVIEGVTVDQITFNYLQPSQCFRKIAELTGRNWYIDYDKDIHYFPLTTESAPFDIDSSTSTYSDLEISKDSSQVKNRVYVRGGTYLSDFTTYTEVGDGEKTEFVLPDKPHDVTLEVNIGGGGWTEKTVGIKNVDLTGYDWYLNFQEKYVEQDAGGSVLTSSDKIRVTYKYDIPILVAVEDDVSQSEFGVKEFAIFDKTITTTQQARDRASAELTDYANDLVEGTFTTRTNGFKSGQYININLSDYDVNTDYIIQKVRAKSIGGGVYDYTISIASAKTIGMIRFLIKLLEDNKNLVELDDNEVVDELFSLTDSLLSDSLLDSLVIDSQGVYFTWAVDSLEATQTRARWNLSQWG